MLGWSQLGTGGAQSAGFSLLTGNGVLDTSAAGGHVRVDPAALDRVVVDTTPDENDAPVIALPAAQTVPEDGLLRLEGSAAIRIFDEDAAAFDVMKVTLSTQNGRLRMVRDEGLEFLGASTGTTVSFRGSLQNINAALATLQFSPDRDFSGPVFIDVHVDDLGNRGTGGPKTDTDSLKVTVTPVVDPPTADLVAFPDLVVREGGDPVQLFQLASFANPEGGETLSGLTITGLDGGDRIDFSQLDGITGQRDGPNRFVFAGTASLPVYQQLALGLRISTDADDPKGGQRIYQVTVSDGDRTSAPEEFVVTFQPVNDAPTLFIVPDGLRLSPGENRVSVGGGIRVTDPDSPALRRATIEHNGPGTLEVPGALPAGLSAEQQGSGIVIEGAASPGVYQDVLGGLQYLVPAVTPDGRTTFVFKVDDGEDLSAPATRTLEYAAPGAPASSVPGAGAGQPLPPLDDRLIDVRGFDELTEIPTAVLRGSLFELPRGGFEIYQSETGFLTFYMRNATELDLLIAVNAYLSNPRGARGATASAARRPEPKTFRLPTRNVKLKPGERIKVKVPLTAAARKQIRSARPARLKARFTFTVQDAKGNLKRFSKTVTFKVKAKPRRS